VQGAVRGPEEGPPTVAFGEGGERDGPTASTGARKSLPEAHVATTPQLKNGGPGGTYSAAKVDSSDPSGTLPMEGRVPPKGL
jgi:hypothetical protein